MIGDLEVTTLLDGAIPLDGPHPIFGENVAADQVAELARANFLPADRMETPFTVTIVNDGTDLVLFDTGNGASRRPDAGWVLGRLSDFGLTPGDITIVALTHFHGDHIGGLMEGGSPAFPNARYLIGSTEYDFWFDGGLLSDEALKGRAELVQSNVVPLAAQAEMIGPGAQVIGGVTALESFGHTPGHLSYHLESGGERLVLLGDVCNHYVVSMRRPDWNVRFDMDKEAAVAARREVLGMIADDKVPFIGYHMPPPAVGYLEPLGEGFCYVAAGYQLNL